MSIIYGYLSVKEDESLLKAIAAETVGSTDNEVTESFLDQMSTDYPKYPGPRKTVVENPDEQDKSD